MKETKVSNLYIHTEAQVWTLGRQWGIFYTSEPFGSFMVNPGGGFADSREMALTAYTRFNCVAYLYTSVQLTLNGPQPHDPASVTRQSCSG